MWPDYWGLCPPNWQPGRCSLRPRSVRRSATPATYPIQWCPPRCCAAAPYPTTSWILDSEYSERWSISYCLHCETRTICRALDWTGQCTRSRRHRLPWCHLDSVWSPCSVASLADLQSAQVKHIICNYLSLNSMLIRILFTQYTLFLSLSFPYTLSLSFSPFFSPPPPFPVNLQCTTSRHLSSMELPSMNWFSARHVKYLPSSSRLGVNVSMLRDWLSGSLN